MPEVLDPNFGTATVYLIVCCLYRQPHSQYGHVWLQAAALALAVLALVKSAMWSHWMTLVHDAPTII